MIRAFNLFFPLIVGWPSRSSHGDLLALDLALNPKDIPEAHPVVGRGLLDGRQLLGCNTQGLPQLEGNSRGHLHLPVCNQSQTSQFSNQSNR